MGWRVETGMPVVQRKQDSLNIWLARHSDPVASLSWSPCGQMVATCAGTKAYLWGSARTYGNPVGAMGFLKKFEGHTLKIFAASVSADGSHWLTASEDQTARLWNAQTGL